MPIEYYIEKLLNNDKAFIEIKNHCDTFILITKNTHEFYTIFSIIGLLSFLYFIIKILFYYLNKN